eukprot:g7988.t1
MPYFHDMTVLDVQRAYRAVHENPGVTAVNLALYPGVQACGRPEAKMPRFEVVPQTELFGIVSNPEHVLDVLSDLSPFEKHLDGSLYPQTVAITGEDEQRVAAHLRAVRSKVEGEFLPAIDELSTVHVATRLRRTTRNFSLNKLAGEGLEQKFRLPLRFFPSDGEEPSLKVISLTRALTLREHLTRFAKHAEGYVALAHTFESEFGGRDTCLEAVGQMCEAVTNVLKVLELSTPRSKVPAGDLVDSLYLPGVPLLEGVLGVESSKEFFSRLQKVVALYSSGEGALRPRLLAEYRVGDPVHLAHGHGPESNPWKFLLEEAEKRLVALPGSNSDSEGRD